MTKKTQLLLSLFVIGCGSLIFASYVSAQCVEVCDPCIGGCTTSGPGCYGPTMTVWSCVAGNWVDSGSGCACVPPPTPPPPTPAPTPAPTPPPPGNVTVTFTKAGTGTGTVSDNFGSSCDPSCPGGSMTYVSGTSVTLTATPAGGSVFAGWGGDCAGFGVNPTCTGEITSNSNVTATFALAGQVSVTLAKAGSGFGTISDNFGNSCDPSCPNAIGTYPANSTVTLTATPQAGSVFAGWGGACAGFGVNPTCTGVIASNQNVTATFNLSPATPTPAPGPVSASCTVYVDSAPTPTPAPPQADVTCFDGVSFVNGPCAVAYATPVTLAWCGSGPSACSGATSCNLYKEGALVTSGGASTVYSSTALINDTYYELRCSGPGGLSLLDKVDVTVNAAIPAAINVTVAVNNSSYCSVGPHAQISWDYADPADVPVGADPQTAYQVLVRDVGSGVYVFDSCPAGPDTGTCIPGNTSTTYFVTGVFQFGRTYEASVKVRNSAPFEQWSPAGVMSIFCNNSSCSPAVTWNVIPHAAPDPDFITTPINPSVGSPVTFSELGVVFYGTVTSPAASWSWNFGDGTATVHPPVDSVVPLNIADFNHTYNALGIYNVTLRAEDDLGITCSTVSPVIVQKYIPKWREVIPR